MGKSINLQFGDVLKLNGYKMSTANHFEKKYKKFLFCVDLDLADHLLLRLLKINEFKETKCIKSKSIENLSTLTKDEFIKMVLEIEEEYLTEIDN